MKTSWKQKAANSRNERSNTASFLGVLPSHRQPVQQYLHAVTQRVMIMEATKTACGTGFGCASISYRMYQQAEVSCQTKYDSKDQVLNTKFPYSVICPTGATYVCPSEDLQSLAYFQLSSVSLSIPSSKVFIRSWNVGCKRTIVLWTGSAPKKPEWAESALVSPWFYQRKYSWKRSSCELQ